MTTHQRSWWWHEKALPLITTPNLFWGSILFSIDISCKEENQPNQQTDGEMRHLHCLLLKSNFGVSKNHRHSQFFTLSTFVWKRSNRQQSYVSFAKTLAMVTRESSIDCNLDLLLVPLQQKLINFYFHRRWQSSIFFTLPIFEPILELNYCFFCFLSPRQQ